MSLEISGQLVAIGQTVQVNEKFKKREFVVAMTETVTGNTYTNYAKMQVVQAKCDILDRYKIGDNVKVAFNLKGNRNEKDGKVSYITNLDAWRIEYQQGAGQQQGGYQPAQQHQQPQQGGYNAPQHYAPHAQPAQPVYQQPNYGPAAGTGTVDDLPF